MNELQHLFALQAALALEIVVHVFDKIHVGKIAGITIGHHQVFPAIIVIIGQ
jgi:hypothetical protein